VSGIDDESIAAAQAGLRDLKAEIQRRTRAVKDLPRDVAPDGKVTRAVADRRTLGLHPLMVIVDECQNLYAHPLYGKEAGELTVYCIKLGRALGVMLILATQRPDADSLPTGVSANVSIRFCLRVMGQVENDMILGTSAYKNGIRATTLRPTDRGIGYLVGSADDPLIVRASYVDKVAAEKVADRARALRVAAGTLDGYAAGIAPAAADPAAATLLDDVAAVVGAEPKMWSETIVARLAELRPALYTGWAPDQLAAALKPHGVSTTQVWGRTDDGRPANRRGIDRAQLHAAITDRDKRRPPG
jgi:S-DNA-T family DNA segregation ATPase FtsK/SpoIIIE